MKICLVSYEYPPFIYGGAGTYAELLARGLVQFGIDVQILAHGPTSSLEDNIIRINTPDIRYWRRLFFSHYGSKILGKVVEENSIDLLHFNEPHVILTTPNVPIVSSFHSTQINEFITNVFLSKNPSIKGLIGSILKCSVGSMGEYLASLYSDHIICPCMDLKNKLQRQTLKKKDSIHVVPNGIDLDWTLYKGTEDVLNKFCLEKDKFFLFMGRLDPIKGVDYLLQAFNKFNSRELGFKLAIAGSGYYDKYLKSRANSIKNVIFLGQISEMEEKQALYGNCTGVILPSLYEAFPMVILEAMSFGKPIIASNVGGIPEMIENGHNGFLVEPKAYKDIEKYMEILALNQNIGTRMGKHNKELVGSKFTYKNMAKKTIKVYEKAL